MIITSVEVSGAGRFRTGVRLSGLGPGVNVLAAANEAGKSTLFRAVRTCFFKRHTSKAKEICDLGSQDAELPLRVAVEFQRAGRDYRIDKTFLRSARALLTENGSPIAQGHEADERLSALLGLPQGSQGIQDEASFGLLWVGQSQSFKLDAPTAGAATALNAAIAAEVGGLLGGERARAVLAKVREELTPLETSKGPKAGGPWQLAIQRRDQIREREGELRAKLERLEADFAALADGLAELGRLNDPTLRGGCEARLREADQDLRRARETAVAIDRLELELRAAESDRCLAEGRLARLAEAAQRIVSARQEIAALDGAISFHEAERAESSALLRACAEASVEADRQLASLAAESENLARLERAEVAAERLSEWRPMRDEAVAAARRRAEIGGELACIRLDKRLVEEIGAAESRVARLAFERETAAPRLDLVLGPEAGDAVRVDGAPAVRDQSRAVLDATTIAIAGLATITVTPASADAATRAQLAEAERLLSELLSKGGATSPAEAREALERKRDLEREQAELGRRLGALPKGPAGQDGLAFLEERIAHADATIQAALGDASRQALPCASELAERRSAILASGIEARSRRQAAGAALEAARARDGEIATRLAASAARRNEQASLLERALEAAPDATREADLARLAADLRAAEARAGVAGEALAAKQAAAPSPEVLADLEARVDRLTQAIANLDLKRIELDKDIHALEVGIGAVGGSGAGEDHASALAELELAEREVRRWEDHAASLRLLRSEIEREAAASHERYFAPVREKLRPFLDGLFPQAELALGCDFIPTGLTRHAPERHDLLSDGTREQIAVLVRLALGSMLAEKGEPVPIILDDALVFSDDERIDRMFDALNRASRRQQVIVLTCRSRSFGPLGGNLLRIEPVAG